MKPIVTLSLTALALGFVPATFAGQTGPTAPTDPAASMTTAAPQQSNTRLASLVPAGMSTEDACNGFKDMKDCSATLHAAQNLNIPFADLKGKVTGGESLSSAIHSLKPQADARTEVRKAEKQASEDVSGPQG